MKINLTLAILYLTLFIVDIIYVRKSFQTYQISLILGLTISILSSLVLFFNKYMYMCTYRLIILLLAVYSTLALAYSFYIPES